MPETQPTPPLEAIWRVNRGRATSWRAWDGEMVVYDDLSGDTLKLDVIAAAAFKTLLAGPAATTAIVEHLAVLLELEPDPRLRRVAEIALGRIAAAGLAEARPVTPEAAGRPDAIE
jgi:hypothetical protein